MNTMFPIGFPLPTAFYLTVYVLTLAIHVVLMNYVIAGTAYLAWGSVFPGKRELIRARRPFALVLRDWMPFALGGAITAGVAPLLFVQIIYQKQFYTANLLLFHRWMVILPALIVGFYLLYLYKSRLIADWPGWARVAIGLVAFACFAFTGYSWTENHLLALQGQATWSAFYASEQVFYFDRTLLPRLAVWFLGAFPTVAMLGAWQLRFLERRESGDRPPERADGAPLVPHMGTGRVRHEAKAVANFAQIGLALAAIGGLVYLASLPEETRSVLTGALALPYLIVAVLAVGAQGFGWWQLRVEGTFRSAWLWMITISVAVSIVTMTVVREAVRLASVDVTALYERHARAAEIGGLWAFLLFFVLGAAVITYCLIQLRRAQPRPA